MVKILSRILARQKAKNLKWEVNGVASFFTSIGEYSVITSMIEGPRYCLEIYDHSVGASIDKIYDVAGTEELFNLARRQALNVEASLDLFLKELRKL